MCNRNNLSSFPMWSNANQRDSYKPDVMRIAEGYCPVCGPGEVELIPHDHPEAQDIFRSPFSGYQKLNHTRFGHCLQCGQDWQLDGDIFTVILAKCHVDLENREASGNPKEVLKNLA